MSRANWRLDGSFAPGCRTPSVMSWMIRARICSLSATLAARSISSGRRTEPPAPPTMLPSLECTQRGAILRSGVAEGRVRHALPDATTGFRSPRSPPEGDLVAGPQVHVPGGEQGRHVDEQVVVVGKMTLVESRDRADAPV